MEGARVGHFLSQGHLGSDRAQEGYALLKWFSIGQAMLRTEWWLNIVVLACNASTLGGRGRWITCGQEIKTILANRVKAPLY